MVALKKEMAVITAVAKAWAEEVPDFESPNTTYYLHNFSLAPRRVHSKTFDEGVQVSGPASEIRGLVMGQENREELGFGGSYNNKG